MTSKKAKISLKMRRLSFSGAMVLAFMLVSITLPLLSVQQVYAATPPLPAGCYNSDGSNFTLTRCTNEFMQRSIASPTSKCFIVSGPNGQTNQEVDCRTGGLPESGVLPECGTEQACAQMQTNCQTNGGRWNSDTRTCTSLRGDSQPSYIENDCTEGVDKENCGIVRYIVIFIQLLSAVAGVVIVASITMGGIQYSAAGSDPQKVSAAKNRIRNAIIALVFFLFGFAFLNYLVPGGVL